MTNPLTQLSDDEKLFQSSIAEFMQSEVKPFVEEMDEKAKHPPKGRKRSLHCHVQGSQLYWP